MFSPLVLSRARAGTAESFFNFFATRAWSCLSDNLQTLLRFANSSIQLCFLPPLECAWLFCCSWSLELNLLPEYQSSSHAVQSQPRGQALRQGGIRPTYRIEQQTMFLPTHSDSFLSLLHDFMSSSSRPCLRVLALRYPNRRPSQPGPHSLTISRPCIFAPCLGSQGLRSLLRQE